VTIPRPAIEATDQERIDMAKSLHELIASTSELRSLPSTTMQLTQLLDEDTVDASSVLEIIEKDPSLTSNLLKLANSAYYGMRRQVATTRDALVLLGNQTVVNLAFATSMGDILRGPLAAYRLDRNQMWHHALGTALGAASLMKLKDGSVSARERAFTGGLVHDIGKLLLNRPLKDELEQLPPDGDFEQLLAAEKRILGFDHCEAGAVLGESWNFPAALVDVIRWHHSPGQAELVPDLARAVAGANLLACHLGWSGGTGPVAEAAFWTGLLELEYDEEAVRPLLLSVPRDLENMLNMIGQSL
jgi:HD-like signal output (HDOD) protein